ncbi:MAG: ATP-dependent RecD-like DNA helicase [Lachnospiraceae bacterium]|nr:ATP-dependent RecD-like DNA helicase [Lachnospiraceae bacterium]
MVQHIIYQNPDNYYTVLELVSQGEETVCVGIMPRISEGDHIRVSGEYVEHSVYGVQLKVSGFELEAPEDEESMERYLASGSIKGIGPTMAARIVKAFGEDTFRIIEEEPERLAEVKGISDRIARNIYMQFYEKQDMRRSMMFLQQYGITPAYAVKIYERYGNDLYSVIREDPYRLAREVSGIGFRLADAIAMEAGFSMNSEFRIRAGIVYALLQKSLEGHTYVPAEELKEYASELLTVEVEDMEKHLDDLVIDRQIVRKKDEEEDRIYLTRYYYLELGTAFMLSGLNRSFSPDPGLLERTIAETEKCTGIILDEIQKEAVRSAAENGITVITGGPGTGKTTTINTIIRYFTGIGKSVALAAPTGRAAKRMTEATGYDASTIHRLLELSGAAGSEDEGVFGRNEDDPLDQDVIIIDEMSMVDISLMNVLLKAVRPGTRLVLSGDEYQLPSVGPGNVLADIIRSERFKVVRLKKIFRQALESNIVRYAHMINEGRHVDLKQKHTDFFLLERDNARDILGVTAALVKDLLPEKTGIPVKDIQVMTPMRKGELGVLNLNKVLQRCLNPEAPDKTEWTVNDTVFRTGDKVMQIKNNYQAEWEVTGDYNIVTERGTGIFNGDIGIIREINLFARTVTVEFDDMRKIVYSFNQLEELEHAYAITIHKAQGSEYPAVIIPLLTGPRLLFNRNILYTAITRAERCVALVGSGRTVDYMTDTVREMERYSSLDLRIKEAIKR